MSEEKTIEQLLAELNEAKAALVAATEEEIKASHRVTDSQNVYNGICKKIDAALAKMKNDSPAGTDWRMGARGGSS
jgi:hypothetical protein